MTEAVIAGRNGTALTFTGAADGGSSGSPMLRNGWVTGVVTEKAGDFGFAIPAAAVAFALEGWGVKVRDRDRPIAPEPSQAPPTGDLSKTKIAFRSNDGIYVMDANGDNVVRLLKDDSEDPAWSPDGKSIAYTLSREVGSFGIYVIDLQTHRSRRLTDPDATARYYSPSWSRRIVADRRRSNALYNSQNRL